VACGRRIEWGDVRDSRAVQIVATRPRVCVVDSKEAGPAYARIDECAIEVMGSLPSLAQLSPKSAATYDAIIVGCSERLLLSPAFRSRVRKLAPIARLIALMDSPTSVNGNEALALGFAGLASRDITPRAFERTVAAAARGETAFPRGVLDALLDTAHLAPRSAGRSAGPSLTPRQDQIVELIAQGATDREIAGILRISQSTAHKHVQNALRRLNAKTRSQLVAASRRPAFPRGFLA
jgi:DNA-binding NarL/FixJ family response regulator